jgi:hypothetical protein
MGQPDDAKTQFLYIVSGNRRSADETMYAIDTDAHGLRPVQIESPEKQYESMPRPGEEMTQYNVNYFADNQQPWFELTLRREAVPDCCPSEGQIFGTYKIIKKTQTSDGADKLLATVWKFIPAAATRQPLPLQ